MWAENKLLRGVEIMLIVALTSFATWLRFYKLGHLGLWGDEGFTYLAVEGVLKHGVPILPSGNEYYKDLLFTYLSALPCSFWGMTEGALRSMNSLCGVLLIPTIYFVGKRYFPAPLALVGAALLTLSHWEIEFARQARYYCQLQLFYLLSLHFFWRGFVERSKPFQKVALAFFFLASLTHQLAYTLVFCFLILAILKGPRILFYRNPGERIPRILLFGLLFVLWVGLLEFFELFFWKAGSVAHFEKEKSVWKILFENFHWGYFREFYWLFPKMSWVAAIGIFFAFLWRRQEPLSFMVGIGIACLLFMGIGHAHLQPRYIFYLYPLFIFAYLSGIYGFFRLGKRICQWLRLPLGRIVGLAAMLAVLAISVEAYNPHYSVRIPKSRYGKGLLNKFQISTTMYCRLDYQTTGQYVRERATPDDIIVGMHMIYQYIYAGRCDYWMWSAGPNVWDAIEDIENKEGKRRDRYVGVPLIRNREEFETLLKNSKGRRVWVITTPSLEDEDHILPDLRDYLKNQPDKVQYHSPDKISMVYLFQ